MFDVFVNGELRKTESLTVGQLVEELELGSKTIALEKNREIISRSAYGTEGLIAGDKIEIVHCVAGG